MKRLDVRQLGEVWGGVGNVSLPDYGFSGRVVSSPSRATSENEFGTFSASQNTFCGRIAQYPAKLIWETSL